MTQVGTPQKHSRAGADYLDRVWPEWYLVVNPATLNIGCPRNSVLGQLGGKSFSRGAMVLGIDDLFCIENGFLVNKNLLSPWKEYRELTLEWQERIAERRKAFTCVVAPKEISAPMYQRRIKQTIIVAAFMVICALFAW